MERRSFFGLLMLLMLQSVSSQNGAQRKYFCPNQRSFIFCRGQATVVHIVSATFGRTTKHICRGGQTQNTQCAERVKTLAAVKARCDGQRYCSLNNKGWEQKVGDPCPGTSKYIEVVYKCGPRVTPPTIGPPNLANLCHVKADIYFLLDASGSVTSGNFPHILRFVTSVINVLEIGKNAVRVGVIRFESNTNLMFPLNRYYTHKALKEKIRHIPYTSRGTATYKALEQARNVGFTAAYGDRPGVQNMIILITDGISNNRAQTVRQGNLCKQSGIKIMCVAAQAPNQAKLELISIASKPAKAHVYIVNRFSEMVAKAKSYRKKVCQELQANTSSVPKPNPPPVAKKPPAPKSSPGKVCSKGKADIYFLIDASGSVRKQNFHHLLDFVTSLISHLKIGRGAVNVGVYRFDSYPTLIFPLNRHFTKAALKQHIRSIRYTSRGTATDKVLQQVRTIGFTARNGDRPGVKNFIILITDGVSNNRRRTAQQANLCKRSGIRILCVAAQAPRSAKRELITVASKPANQHVFVVSQFKQMVIKSADYSKTICKEISPLPVTTVAPPISTTTTTTPPMSTTTTTTSAAPPKACAKNVKADIYFMIDASGSVTSSNFPHLLKFVNAVIDSMPIGKDGVRVGVFRFEHRIDLIFPLNKYYDKNQLKKAVAGIRYTRGMTSTDQVLKALRDSGFTVKKGDRQSVHNIGVLITDGVSNHPKKTFHQANLTKKAGIELFCIGVKLPNTAEIKKIASSQKHVFAMKTYPDLLRQAKNVQSSMCNSIKSKMPAPVCKTNAKADIYFMIDASGSVTSSNFPHLLKFVNALIDSMPIGKNGVRVGVFRFEHRIDLIFPLNKYYNKTQLKKAVLGIGYTRGITFTDQVLKALKQIGFTAKNGDRPGIHNIGVLITDGLSTYRNKTLQQAILAKQAGIELFCVGAQLPTTVEIDKIASTPKKQHVFSVKKFFDLLNKSEVVKKQVCNSINNHTIKPCKTPAKVDIYFLIDTSEMVLKKNMPSVLNFVSAIIDGLPVGQNAVRVGVYLYHFHATLVFPLNKYYDKKQMQAEVNKIKYNGMGCSVFDVFHAVRTRGFTAKNGDRRGVHNKAILVSAGIPYGLQPTILEADLTKKANIEIFILAVQAVSKAGLAKLPSPPNKGHLFHIEKFTKMMRKAPEYSEKICKEVKKHVCTLDIYFVIDASEMVGKQNFNHVIDFVTSVVSSLKIGQHRVGVVTYAEHATVVFPLNKYTTMTQLKAAVSKIGFKGQGCRVDRAIKILRTLGYTTQNGDRPSSRNVSVLVTGGIPFSLKEAVAEAAAARKSGIELYCVGVQMYSSKPLMQIASNPGKSHIVIIKQYGKMKQYGPEVSNMLCNSSNTAVNKTSQPIKPGECKPDLKADVYFLVDASGSVRHTNFPRLLTFVNQVVARLPVGKDTVRVGFYRFDHNSNLIFPLNKYYKKSDVMRAVKAVKFTAGGTSIQTVLRDARTVGFTPAKGDRQGVRNIGILVTDGISNNRQATQQQAAAAKRAGIELFGVGIQIPTITQLQHIVSKPVNKHLFVVQSFTQANSKGEEYSKNMCDALNKMKP